VSLRIDHLFHHPERIPLVASWIRNAFWRDRPDYSVETFECLLRQADDPGRIPLSLLAIADGEPAGTVNLIHSDSPTRPHLHPWLAALFVVAEHRHRGVGSALCRALLAEARRLEIPELFLGTDIPAFYAALGAEIYEQVSKTDCIMRFGIDAPARLRPDLPPA
jgi:predicted N-acetyltransferase YhbS